MSSPSVAIIGAGKIVEVGHLPGFVEAGAEIAAICARTETHMNALADRFGINRRYTDWRVMLAEGGFDAISICTPPALHREMAVAALEAGYHVLVEKPVAVALDECASIDAAAESSDRIAMGAHNQRFRTQHRIVAEIVRSGRLGRVVRAHAVFAHGGPEYWSPDQSWYFDPAQAGRGVLIDLGYHKVDLLRWLLGQEVTSIHAYGTNAGKPTSAEDNVASVIQFDGGTIATVQASWTHQPGVPDSVSLACERGTIEVPSDPNGPVVVTEIRDGEQLVSTHESGTSDGPGWRTMVGAFVEAVRNGSRSPVPVEEARRTLAAVLSAYQSMPTTSTLSAKGSRP